MAPIEPSPIGPGHPEFVPGHPDYEARVVAGAMEPVYAERLMNLDRAANPGAGGAAAVSGGGAALRAVLDVPGIGRVLAHDLTGIPTTEAVARARAAADSILDPDHLATLRFTSPEAAQMMGESALNMVALALVVRHFTKD